MRSDELFVALLSFMAFVALAPVWVHYLGEFTAERPWDAYLAWSVLPTAAALFLFSWVKPELSRVVLGLFSVMAALLLFPYWWEFTDMVTGALGGQPLAQFVMQLVVSALVLALLVSLGRRTRGIAR